MGDFLSGPPPVGSIVVFIAVLVLTGTEGYNRRATRVKTIGRAKTKGETYFL
jgi:hypothetical protein